MGLDSQAVIAAGAGTRSETQRGESLAEVASQMAGVSLSDALRENCCLEDIDLSWNKVGERGAKSLLHVISDQSRVKSLRLVGNQVRAGSAST